MKIKKVSFVWKNIDKTEQYLLDVVTCKIETDDGEVYEGSATQAIPRQLVLVPSNSQRIVTAHEIGEVAAYNHTIGLMHLVTNTQV